MRRGATRVDDEENDSNLRCSLGHPLRSTAQAIKLVIVNTTASAIAKFVRASNGSSEMRDPR